MILCACKSIQMFYKISKLYTMIMIVDTRG